VSCMSTRLNSAISGTHASVLVHCDASPLSDPTFFLVICVEDCAYGIFVKFGGDRTRLHLYFPFSLKSNIKHLIELLKLL
jgi:hypothetical protein